MTDTSGGFYDEFGQYIEPPNTQGITLNSIPQPQRPIIPQPAPRVINTPDSSSGKPFRLDPSAVNQPEFATPQGGPLTTTPNSRFGTPAPGIRNDPTGQSLTVRPMFRGPSAPASPFTNLPAGSPLLTAIGALANAPNTPQGMYDQANRVGSAVDQNPIVAWMIQHGMLSPSPQWGAPQGQAAPMPATQTSAQGMPAPPNQPPPPTSTLPPFNRAPPPNYLPPFNRGPIPPYTAQTPGRAPTVQQRPGAGGSAAPPAPSMINLQPQSQGEYFATTGNARTPVWQPGGFASPPAPHFQTPLTPMFGPGQWLNTQRPAAAAPQTGNARSAAAAPLPQAAPRTAPPPQGNLPGIGPNTKIPSLGNIPGDNVWIGGTPGTGSPYMKPPPGGWKLPMVDPKIIAGLY